MRVQMTGLNEPRMPIQAECSVSVNARLASRNLLGARWCCRSCSPMDPMDVLKYHQHRPAPRRSFAREVGSSWLSTASKNFSRLRCGLRLSELLGLTVDRVRRLPVLLVITFRRPKQAVSAAPTPVLHCALANMSSAAVDRLSGTCRLRGRPRTLVTGQMSCTQQGTP